MPTAAATMIEPEPPTTEQRVAEIVRKVTTVATLPEVTSKIIRTVEDPRSTAARLHQLVSHDPSLVTRILKVVNSAFYGLPGQVGSIERAIVLLGLNAVKNIAVAASLGQLFRGVKLCEGFTAKDLWTHCVEVAVTARDLAKQLKLPIADEAFLAGMIHDIGILVSLQTAPEQTRKICDRSRAGASITYSEIERELMGVDHEQLGMALAEHWKFPKPCQLAAGHHHRPAALEGEGRTLVAIVHIADVLCCQVGKGFNLTAKGQEIDPALLEELNLDAEAVERTKANMGSMMETASSLFA